MIRMKRVFFKFWFLICVLFQFGECQQKWKYFRKGHCILKIRSFSVTQTFSNLMWQLCAAMMSWVSCLLKDSELFILFAENRQIPLKISVIPILLTFMYRTRAIITRGLYTFYPLFEVHLCTVTFDLMYG